MIGHVIDGKNLVPATGYLIMVWETIGMLHGEMYTEISVVFEDVKCNPYAERRRDSINSDDSKRLSCCFYSYKIYLLL